MTAPERAPLGAALALLLTVVSLAGALSPLLMGLTVIAMTLLVAVGWPDLLELPAVGGTRVVIAGTGIAAAIVGLFGADRVTPLQGVAMVTVVGIFGAFAQQMLRHTRHRLSWSLTGTVGGLLPAAMSSCWILAADQALELGTMHLLTAASAGLALALLVQETTLHRLLRLAVSTVAAAVVTVLVAGAMGPADPWAAATLGVVVAVVASAVHLLLSSMLVARESVPSLTVGAAPVATIGVAVLLAVQTAG